MYWYHNLVEINNLVATEYAMLENVMCLITVWNLLSMTHPRVMLKASVVARIFDLSLGTHRRKACHQRIDPITLWWEREAQRNKLFCLSFFSLARSGAKHRKHDSWLWVQAFSLPILHLMKGGNLTGATLLCHKRSYADPAPSHQTATEPLTGGTLRACLQNCSISPRNHLLSL